MKDNFNVHEWNLKRYLAEQQERSTNLSQLTFDQITPLFPREMKWDGIPFPVGGDVLRKIKREDDYENWKKDIMAKYGDVQIQLNPKGVWYDYVKIVDDKFSKEKEQSTQSKSDFLDRNAGSID
jgi:hypothetical protein